MSHPYLRTDASTSARPGGSPPGRSPQRTPAERSEFTEAVSRPPDASGHPMAGSPGFADAAGLTRERTAQLRGGEHPRLARPAVRDLAGTANGQDNRPAPSRATTNAQAAGEDRSSLRPSQGRAVRSWPLLVLALPAVVAVWSGWVGIGQMTGFGQVHPLPGIWDSFHLDTAVTLPVGVEAYAAYALRAWLSASAVVSARTRRFARWSATGSLVLGMAGQVAYHLLAQSHAAGAPWGITTAVSCLPVLVLGMGAALAHLLRADSCHLEDQASSPPPGQAGHHAPHRDHAAATIRPSRLAEAATAATLLSTEGKRVSRRTLRTAGVHGSNADLGALARILSSWPANGTALGGATVLTGRQVQ
jgi:hypothetical protein